MLVLSRQINQSIMIGDDIELTIVDIKGDKVRVGINAPAHVAVHRKEVYLSIKAENVEAAQSSDADLEALNKMFEQKRSGIKKEDG
ncbi:MAG: carbon storage regulator CsrA [Planctomycetes bacterium]|nr:carbon storage regulator CsrA [Planctomycetota bacterium]